MIQTAKITTNPLVESLKATHLAQLVERAIPMLACNLRPDIRTALERATQTESHPRGREVLRQLIANADIAASEQVPLCQDTGYVWVMLELGACDSKDQPISVPSDIFSMVDAAVDRAFSAAPLRKSIVCDALLNRQNTQNNTPAFCEVQFNPKLKGARLHIMLKGGGSDNASRLNMLTPNAGLSGVKDIVMSTVQEKAANACPPLIIGVGVGGSFDSVAGISKKALLREIGSVNPDEQLAALEANLLEEINATGIGPGGFGGATTALAVHIATAPCHIAALPVAVSIGCNSTRTCSIDLEHAAAEGQERALGTGGQERALGTGEQERALGTGGQERALGTGGQEQSLNAYRQGSKR